MRRVVVSVAAVALTAVGVTVAIIGSLFVLASRAMGSFEGEPVDDFWSFLALLAAIAVGIVIARLGMRLFRRSTTGPRAAR